MSKLSKALAKYKKLNNLTSNKIFSLEGSQKSKGSGSPKSPDRSFDYDAKPAVFSITKQNLSGKTTHPSNQEKYANYAGSKETADKGAKANDPETAASSEIASELKLSEKFDQNLLPLAKSRNVEIDKNQLSRNLIERYNYDSGKLDFEASEKESESTSIRDILHVVFKRKSQFILFFLSVMCTVTIGTFLSKPVYNATSQVLIKMGRESIYTPTMGNAAPIVNYNQEERINSEIEIIKSRSLAEQVALELGPTSIYPELNNVEPGLIDRIKKYVKIKLLKKNEKELTPEEIKMTQLEAATNIIIKNTTVEPVPKSNIVKISYENNSPDITAKVTNRLAEKYIDYHLEINRTPQIASFLSNQTNMLRNKYEESEEQLKKLKEKNKIISLQEERTLILKQFADLQTEINKSQSQLQETENRIESLRGQAKNITKYSSQESKSNPNRGLIDNLEAKLIELEVKKNDLDTKYTDIGTAGTIKSRLAGNIDDEIKLVKQKIKEINEKNAKKETFDYNPLYQSLHERLMRDEAEIGPIKAKIESQKNQLEEYRRQLNTLNLIETKMDQLEQQVEVDKANFRLYLKKYEESQIEEELDKARISSVTLLEPARIPLNPISPKLMLNLILGFTLAVFGGFGLVFLVEHFNDRLEKIEDFEEILNLPILATIPELKKKKYKK